MAYQILGHNGVALDSLCEIGDAHLILHSRGGTKGTQNVRNTEYSKGLRALLNCILTSNLTLENVYVDSNRVQSIPIDERMLFDLNDKHKLADDVFVDITSRMRAVGRRPNAEGTGGNATKRLRFDFESGTSKSAIFNVLDLELFDRGFRGADRLPVEFLNQVTTPHIIDAVNFMLGGLSPDGYGSSTDYDVVLDDGSRLPPKAVFGLAASEVLGFNVLPRHFSDGEGTPCFNAIKSAGYEIVRKKDGDKPATDQSMISQSAKERTVSRIVKTVNDTVNASGSQNVVRSTKSKHLLLTDENLSEHINDLYNRQGGKCALTGVTMWLDGETKDTQQLCSLDRIDSNRDYELGNLQLVCRFANFWKSDQQNSEFLRLIELVKDIK